MADTAVSMARSMLGGAINKAASAAAAEMSLLIGVRKDIWFIKDELETMRAFLVVAEATKKKDILLKVWAKQVRDLSYNIEDCLCEFMVHVRSQSMSRRLLKLKDRHRIAKQIRDLKSRVEEVSNRNTRYNLIKTEASSSIDEVDSYMEDVRTHSACNIDEAELVGFAKPKEELIKLVDVNSKHGPTNIICVVGMGGLGKTTLARKTYENKEYIRKNFHCCAWITVSQSFFRIELLKNMIQQLLGDESLKNCLKTLEGRAIQVEDLANYLREELKEKRYFIILDDVWTIDAWEWINNIVFPSNNVKGSRIIVTTRDVGLAKKITLESLIYHLKPLELVDATNLLLRKIRKTQKDIESDESTRKVVTKIVNKCGCLPLAILTLGGFLATKKIAEWGHFYNQLPSELQNNPSLEAMRMMVTLSYNHLPSHLKSCFLYMSIFPEDFEIQRGRLVERWIAEGFVRAVSGAEIEDVGKSYFNELINRSMIQPSRVSIEGSVKSCRVHDIIRDVMVSTARDENFVCLGGDIATEENFRHIAYHGSKCQKKHMDWSHVRSLTMFGERPVEPGPLFCSAELRMLRALDLEDAQFEITQKDINNIGLLRHLKYVNARDVQEEGYSNIYKLPRSIKELQGLQTLDTRGTCIATLPAEISKLQSLRSLRCKRRYLYMYFSTTNPRRCLVHALHVPMIARFLYDPEYRAGAIAEAHMGRSSHWSDSKGIKVPRGIGNLKDLRILEVVDMEQTSGKAIKELGELTQLRKLHVEAKGASEKKCKIFCASIEKLTSLSSLTMDAIDWINTDLGLLGTLEWLHSVSSPPPLLRSLKLYGCLGEMMPNWFGNLMHLVKIYLFQSQLNEGSKTMEILGALPNLMLLRLDTHAYTGEKLVFRAGAFPNLKKLDILCLSPLREVRFEEGASPQMEMIQIEWCCLESGIIGIKHLPRLQEIKLGGGDKIGKLDELQGEVDAHPNHPVLRLEDYRRHHLGDVIQGSNDVQAELATQRESSRLQLMPTTSDSGDDLLYTYNSC